MCFLIHWSLIFFFILFFLYRLSPLSLFIFKLGLVSEPPVSPAKIVVFTEKHCSHFRFSSLYLLIICRAKHRKREKSGRESPMVVGSAASTLTTGEPSVSLSGESAGLYSLSSTVNPMTRSAAMVPAFLHPSSAASISGFLNAFHLAAASPPASLESQSFSQTSPPSPPFHLPQNLQQHPSKVQSSPPLLPKEDHHPHHASLMIPVSGYSGMASHLPPAVASSSTSPSAQYHHWGAFLSNYMQTLWQQSNGSFFPGAVSGGATAHQQYLYDCEQYLKEQHFIAALESHCSPVDKSSPKIMLDQHGCLHW